MAFCTECGSNIADGIQFCTNCGKPIKAAKTRVQKSMPPVEEKQTTEAQPKPAPVQAAPVGTPAQITPVNAADQGPPSGSPYAVMSMGDFIIAFIVMSIPVIGLIIGLLWAFGGCKNFNRRNYARAFLVFLIIGVVLGGIIFFSSATMLSGLGLSL
ncbi:MAG: zinc-ribbon domain-containing protein [Treponema sp.]|nr:zinc-ribbon domain-containing protein [Treponema sp.]